MKAIVTAHIEWINSSLDWEHKCIHFQSLCFPFPQITTNARAFSFSFSLQALPYTRDSSTHNPMQHRCVWQWLYYQPMEGQQILYRFKFRLRPLSPSTHTSQPVYVGRRKLPSISCHRTKLFSPLPPSTLSLYRLLMTSTEGTFPVNIFKYEQI